jgi:hypothetical protein
LKLQKKSGAIFFAGMHIAQKKIQTMSHAITPAITNWSPITDAGTLRTEQNKYRMKKFTGTYYPSHSQQRPVPGQISSAAGPVMQSAS